MKLYKNKKRLKQEFTGWGGIKCDRGERNGKLYSEPFRNNRTVPPYRQAHSDNNVRKQKCISPTHWSKKTSFARV